LLKVDIGTPGTPAGCTIDAETATLLPKERPMYWMTLPLRRYADFSGRSRPKEYWMFVLFLFLGIIAMSFADALLGFGASTHYLDRSPFGVTMGVYNRSGLLTLLFSLAAFIPSLAVAVRRLHDSNRSGWWLLFGLVPIIGTITLFIFMIVGGTRGPNRFGPDPFDSATVADVRQSR